MSREAAKAGMTGDWYPLAVGGNGENMAYTRKTVDCWKFYINYGYGDGWEHEITEYTRAAMQENRKAYRENCPYPLRVVRGREPIEATNAT